MGMWAALAALLISGALTPWTAALAARVGAMDVPRDGRRLHARPVPRLGGVSLFVACVTCMSIVDLPTTRLRALVWGATLLVLLGVFDDVFRLRAPLKLTVQLLAAAVTLGGGGGWEGAGAGGVLSLTSVRFLLSVLWLTLLINAHNMIDGMDGLAASIGALEGAALAVALTVQGNAGAATLSCAVAGSCLGYLPYNRHPARVFMGDTGSQFLGLVLGALTLEPELSSEGALGHLVPLLIVALPLSDLAFAVLRRLAKGQNPFAADRGHWHHRLLDAGLDQRQSCRWLTLLGGAIAAVGVLLCREAWYGFAVYATLGALSLVLLLRSRLPARRANE